MQFSLKYYNYKVKCEFYWNCKKIDEYPLFINQYDIEYYADRIDKIKRFCNQNRTPELTMELNKMLQYQRIKQR